jgi:hypothetical protein
LLAYFDDFVQCHFGAEDLLATITVSEQLMHSFFAESLHTFQRFISILRAMTLLEGTLWAYVCQIKLRNA